MNGSLRWGRIVVAALLLEAAITALVTPVGMMYGNPLEAKPGDNTAPYLTAAALGCVVLGFLFGLWAARKTGSRAALHGLLVGVVATVIYFGLCSLAPGGVRAVAIAYGPLVYALLNVLRILGCWAGGTYATSRRAS
jgi:hypothetical protein